jgi:hypothetical protein
MSVNSFLESNQDATSYIDSYFMEFYIKNLKHSMLSLTKVLFDKGINFTFIGGAVRNLYGSHRTTEDLDILVNREDKEKMQNLPIGYIRDISSDRAKVFTLNSPKTKVEVIYSGERAGNELGIVYTDIRNISTKINGIPSLTLEAFVHYKLSSGLYGKRYKDYADIQDVIQKQNLSKTYAQDNGFREDLVQLYEKLWEESNG